MKRRSERVRKHFEEAYFTLNMFLSDQKNFELIAEAAMLMAEALKGGHRIYACGNGGSMCDAMHFAEELSGRYRNNRRALAAQAISDASHLSCVANDYGYQYVFSRYLEGFGQKGDVLLAISTSGNSANVIEAAKTANALGLKTVALSGKDGGALAALADVEIRAPFSHFADRAQEIHIKVIHALIDLIEAELALAE